MHLFKTSLLGSYKPALFSMLINKENVLDENRKLRDEHGNIFFHEYVHFLQDILTAFGLRNLIRMISEYSLVNNEIIASPDPDFPIPYTTQNKKVTLEADFFHRVWGTEALDNDDRDFEIIGIDEEINEYYPDLKHVPQISVNIMYRDTLEHDAFYLGAIHFVENMAYLLEKKFAIAEDAVPFPYKVIEKTIKVLFPGGDLEDRNTLLIMEAALDSHNPAHFFYDFYSYCEAKGLRYSEAAIEEYKQKYVITIHGKKQKTNAYYYESAAQVREGFRIMFNHDRLSELKQWGALLIANTIKIKRAGFSFTDLLVKNADAQPVKDKVDKLINRLGTPIIKDKNHGIFLLSPDKKISEDVMVYLLGLEAVMSVINGTTSICTVVPHCANGPNNTDITNNDCFIKPWDRTKIEPLCLFAQLWVMWGFIKKKVR